MVPAGQPSSQDCMNENTNSPWGVQRWIRFTIGKITPVSSKRKDTKLDFSVNSELKIMETWRTHFPNTKSMIETISSKITGVIITKPLERRLTPHPIHRTQSPQFYRKHR